MKKRGLIIGLIILALFVILIIWSVLQISQKPEVTNAAQRSENLQALDEISDVQMKPTVKEDLSGQVVARMPEIVLELPEFKWFTQEAMQIIGFNLGLTEKASVENLGEQYVWQEDNKTLLISPSTGLVKFTTALETAVFSEDIPTRDTARDSLREFLDETKLPSSFYDMDNLSFNFLDKDRDQGLTEVGESTAKLVRVNIPYAMSGVRLMLPIESYVIVDGSGKVVLMSLLTINLKQTEETLSLININDAREQVAAGSGVVIKSDTLLVSELTSSDQIEIDSFYPAYYLSLKDFYAKNQRRYLSPVYVFTGEDIEVATLAVNK